MTKGILTLAALSSSVMLLGATVSATGLVATHLRCEYLSNPLGIDVVQPRLSWVLAADERGQHQTAYRILVASSEALLKKDTGDLWDSGKVTGGESLGVVYDGKRLTSRQHCFWKVKVWLEDGKESAWSTPAMWSMGLLDPADWQARWIGLDQDDGPYVAVTDLAHAQWIWMSEENPAQNATVGARYFRRTLELPSNRAIKEAVMFIAADNDFRLYVNGLEVGHGNDSRVAKRIVLDAVLRPGRNVLALEVHHTGDGPSPAGLIAGARIQFVDGTVVMLSPDDSWRVTDRTTNGWETATADETGWVPAKTLGRNGMAPWGLVEEEPLGRLTARYLRREFGVEKKVQRATVCVCGLGLFELYVNGQKIGDQVLAPGLAEYDKRAFYVTFDVTGQLKPGANAIGVVLGNGRFYAPRRVPSTRTFGYPKLLLQMQVEYTDGSVEQIVSDDRWKLTTHGPIRANNEYDGEEYDAQLEMNGWSRSGFNDAPWQPAEIVQPAAPVLSAQMIEPIRVMETIRPVAVTNPKPGVYIYDLGQNLVGWCRLKVSGPRGTRVVLRHAETLRPDGTLYLDNLRTARVTDIYILKGQGVETWEPRFTYHGFRYVEVSGFPGRPTLETLDGRVVHDALPRAGEFACSNPLLNEIYHNICWGTRGNYRSIPTDCPQRDERQGWLGDRSAESKGETYLFDVAAFYAKWLADIRDTQRASGSVPDVAPAYWPLYTDGVTWPSSYVMIPHALYDQYGDRRILQTHYDGLKSWIDYMAGFLKDGVLSKDTYGDWCVPPGSPTLIHSTDPKRKTDGALVSTAYFYHDLQLMARSARLLGKAEDARRFGELAEQVKAGFNRRFLNPEAGWYDNGTQTSSVLPLAFGLVPDEHKARVFAHLVDKITNETHNHIGTGLIGGQFLMRVLSDNGRPDLAYTIASQKTYPSWGYMISKGATTMWELWNGDTANPAMNSGNHVMLIGDLNIWFHEYLAGIRPDPEQPGFKHILLRPVPVGDLTWARASHQSPYGEIVSDWKIAGDGFHWSVRIPANSTATVYVPAKDAASVRESEQPLDKANGVKFVRMEDGRAVLAVESGSYHFVVKNRL